jgi:hypothetical protein
MRHLELGDLGSEDLSRHQEFSRAVIVAGCRLFAYTYWPEDENARNQYLAKLVGKGLAAIEGVTPEVMDQQGPINWLLWNDARSRSAMELHGHLWALGGFATLMGGPGLPEIDERITQLHRPVNIVGRVLLSARLIAVHRGGDTSANRAVDVLERTSDFHRTEIWRAWKQFGSIAHISAANVLLNAEPDKIPAELREASGGFDLFSGLGLLLKLAAEFQEFGLSAIPRAQKRPLLDPDRLWQLPPGLKLPNGQLWRDPALRPEFTREIEAYRARAH